MKQLLTTITLALAAQSAIAGGFSPWDDRDVAREATSGAAVATAPTGFAPWRDRDVPMDAIDGQVRITESFGTIFRPWS